MTQLAAGPLDHGRAPDPEVAAPPSGGRSDLWGRVLAVLPDVLVGMTLVYWMTLLTWGTGGREPRVLSYAAVLLLAALMVVRPWNAVPRAVTALAFGLGLAAFGVVATAPTGWEGAPVAASYAVAGQLFLLVAGWARDRVRVTAVVGAVAAAGGLQFGKGWLAWWGGENTANLFQGTFYWHNQAGIFLTAGAVAGAALAAHGLRPYTLLGWFAAPLCGAGVVFTTSRGSQMGLALGLVLLLALALCAARWWAAARIAALAALTYGTAVLLSGPPFFDERISVTAGTQARAGTLEGNGVQRLEDWRRAVEIFKEWPLSGSGFHGFSDATGLVTERRDGVVTAFAHNGFLQAAADGGLLLAVPLWAAVVALLVVAARRLPSALRAGRQAQVAAAVTFLVLVLHSGMDFDWDYPALLAMSALVAAVSTGPLHAPPSAGGRRHDIALGAAAGCLLVLAAVAAWGGGLDLNATVAPS